MNFYIINHAIFSVTLFVDIFSTHYAHRFDCSMLGMCVVNKNAFKFHRTLTANLACIVRSNEKDYKNWNPVHQRYYFQQRNKEHVYDNLLYVSTCPTLAFVEFHPHDSFNNLTRLALNVIEHQFNFLVQQASSMPLHTLRVGIRHDRYPKWNMSQDEDELNFDHLPSTLRVLEATYSHVNGKHCDWLAFAFMDHLPFELEELSTDVVLRAADYLPGTLRRLQISNVSYSLDNLPASLAGLQLTNLAKDVLLDWLPVGLKDLSLSGSCPKLFDKLFNLPNLHRLSCRSKLSSRSVQFFPQCLEYLACAHVGPANAEILSMLPLKKATICEFESGSYDFGVTLTSLRIVQIWTPLCSVQFESSRLPVLTRLHLQQSQLTDPFILLPDDFAFPSSLLHLSLNSRGPIISSPDLRLPSALRSLRVEHLNSFHGHRPNEIHLTESLESCIIQSDSDLTLHIPPVSSLTRLHLLGNFERGRSELGSGHGHRLSEVVRSSYIFPLPSTIREFAISLNFRGEVTPTFPIEMIPTVCRICDVCCQRQLSSKGLPRLKSLWRLDRSRCQICDRVIDALIAHFGAAIFWIHPVSA